MMDFGNWGYPKRPKHLERQIGEQFEYNGVKLEVVEFEEDCKGCYFTQNCKKMKIVLNLDTRIDECYYVVGRESYRHCNLDDNGIETTGECQAYYREDDEQVLFKKVKESWKDKLVRFLTTMVRGSKWWRVDRVRDATSS